MRLVGTASGYWTQPVKLSSGLISHWGSSPLPSVRSLGTYSVWTLAVRYILEVLDRLRSVLNIRKRPRWMNGAFAFVPKVW